LLGETKFGDIDVCFKNYIYNILTYKWKDIDNLKEYKDKKILEFNNDLDITNFKDEINKELKNIYYKNNNIFNNKFCHIFEKYMEYYLSSRHYLQLKIDFCTYQQYLDSDSYIGNESLYFGINMNYINEENDKIKIYFAEEIIFIIQ